MAARPGKDNPFRVGGVVTGAFFANRSDERRRIARALTEPQAHLLVYGPRRMGKSSTLQVVRDDLRRKSRLVVMADLSTASTVADLTNRILQAATRDLGRTWTDVVGALVRRIRVRIGLETDPSGMLLPAVEVSLRDAPIEQQRASLADALAALDAMAAERRTRIGLILDEFQRIHAFGGEDAEAHLRSVIQSQKHVSYVLAGSEEGLIRAMTGRGRPFYKLLDQLHMGPLDPEHLARWIDARLPAARKAPAGVAIVRLAGPRTRDIVQLARETWEAASHDGRMDSGSVGRAFQSIVSSEDAPVRATWNDLTALQQNVLRALAERSTGLTARETTTRYALGDSAAAIKAVRALIKREIIVKEGSRYLFDSPFVRGWVLLNTMADAGRLLPVTHLPD